jgi:simple sugar transport system ATP-binding protein/ribose transport system ATP-binding protein
MAGLTVRSSGTAAGDPIVRVAGLSKSFGGVQAVKAVDLTLRRGEVHALVGENGAGKSTLSKMIAGLVRPDEGRIEVDGREVSFNSPREALRHGIATIAQELALVPGLTLAQNVFLGVEPRRFGMIRRRRMNDQYLSLARRTGFDLPPGRRVRSLRTADQQKIEILRAVSRHASVIIMDEPSAALGRDDAARLHEVIRGLSASGCAVLLISHFLSEVLALADTVTILRDGALIRTGPAATEDEASLITAMLGRSLGSVFPAKTPPGADADPVLAVRSFSAPGVHDVSFEVHAGEIVGLAGLVGAGRSELAHALFGNARPTHGSVVVDGRTRPARSPAGALRQGMFLIPESRKDSGLIPNRSVAENLTLSTLADCGRMGFVSRRRQRRDATAVAEQVQIRMSHVTSTVGTLSGGNQQKVLFARALLRGPRLLIADEPTRGVDVGSRRAIYDHIVAQAVAGLGVLVISSDIEEVLGLAHRVLVMRGGRIVAELTGERMVEHEVLTAAFTEFTGRTERTGLTGLTGLTGPQHDPRGEANQ